MFCRMGGLPSPSGPPGSDHYGRFLQGAYQEQGGDISQLCFIEGYHSPVAYGRDPGEKWIPCFKRVKALQNIFPSPCAALTFRCVLTQPQKPIPCPPGRSTILLVHSSAPVSNFQLNGCAYHLIAFPLYPVIRALFNS